MKIKIEIPGEVKAKQRPMFNARQKRTYTPEKTLKHENLIKYTYRAANHPKLQGAIILSTIANLSIPSSTSNKKREQMMNNEIYPEKKPDFDNIAKIIADGLNKIAFDDDKQIFCALIGKTFADTERTDIMLGEQNDYVSIFQSFLNKLFGGQHKIEKL